MIYHALHPEYYNLDSLEGAERDDWIDHTGIYRIYIYVFPPLYLRCLLLFDTSRLRLRT